MKLKLYLKHIWIAWILLLMIVGNAMGIGISVENYSNLIQGLPLNETNGTVAIDVSLKHNNGTYSATGISYGLPGVMGDVAPYFNGTNTYVDMANGNNFGANWTGNNYTAISFGKITNSSLWNDTSTYRYLWHVRDGVDTSYYSTLGKTTTLNQINYRRRTGGVIVERTYTYTSPPTDWFAMGITYDNTTLKYFLWDSVNGFQELINSTGGGLTDWGNHTPTSGTSVIGAGSLTLQEWVGNISYTYTWNTPLNNTQMQNMMKITDLPIYTNLNNNITSIGVYNYSRFPNLTTDLTVNASILPSSSNITVNVTTWNTTVINFTATNSTVNQTFNASIGNDTFPITNGLSYQITKDGVLQQTVTASGGYANFTNIACCSDFEITQSTASATSSNAWESDTQAIDLWIDISGLLKLAVFGLILSFVFIAVKFGVTKNTISELNTIGYGIIALIIIYSIISLVGGLLSELM